jgi:hypothetical protein
MVYSQVDLLTGSDTNRISAADFKPAFWQAFNVFSFATSDQIAGTVRQNSSGMVLRIDLPTFCSRVNIKCLHKAVK